MATVKLNLRRPAASVPVPGSGGAADAAAYRAAMIARQGEEDSARSGQEVYEAAMQMKAEPRLAAAAAQMAQADYRAAHGMAPLAYQAPDLPHPFDAPASPSAAAAAGDAPTVLGMAVPAPVTDAIDSIKDGIHKHPAQFVAGIAGVALFALMLRGPRRQGAAAR